MQYLVARGYAVFQPNFRGSDGFGRKFAESGYGEWGRKMQDDLTDGVKTLVDLGAVDPARVCIVGASYGGYAALAGAALTPDLYKCAVSIAGISDLDDFIGWRKRNWGSDSEGYTYWLKAIGDPDKDEQRLREVSPLAQADKIKIPVLLIHGDDDFVVPIAQSKAMKKALDKSGHKTELITLKDEGHSYWSDDNEKLTMSAIDNFLWQHLGPGFGISQRPATLRTTRHRNETSPPAIRAQRRAGRRRLHHRSAPRARRPAPDRAQRSREHRGRRRRRHGPRQHAGAVGHEPRRHVRRGLGLRRHALRRHPQADGSGEQAPRPRPPTRSRRTQIQAQINGWQQLQEKWPKTKRYTDYREMLAKQKNIDAVVIATPDHTHALIALAAMDLGKHVYVQKPLAWSVEECRRLAAKATATKLQTQMGNQGHSSDDARLVNEYIQSGAIGTVTEVHVWTNRPLAYWPQGIPRPAPLPRERQGPALEHERRDDARRRFFRLVTRRRTNSPGTCSSARRATSNITLSTTRSTGAAGPTGAWAPSATWARTSSIRRSGRSISTTPPPSRPPPRLTTRTRIRWRPPPTTSSRRRAHAPP